MTANVTGIKLCSLACDRIEELQELDQLTFKESYSRQHWGNVSESERLSALLAVDKRRNQVIGYILFELMPDGILVERFAVHPSSWRRAIGWTLLDSVERIARRRKLSRLVVPFNFDDMFGTDDCERFTAFIEAMLYHPERHHKSLTIYEKELSK